MRSWRWPAAWAGFFNPARFALLGLVVTPADQAQASGQSQATASFAVIVGPPLAAPLLFSLGVQWALAINAVSYLISYLAVRAVRVPPVAPMAAPSVELRYGQQFREGLRFFRRSPVLVTLCVSGSVAMMGVGALHALDVFFVTDNLHTSPRWLGTLGAAFGAGSSWAPWAPVFWPAGSGPRATTPSGCWSPASRCSPIPAPPPYRWRSAPCSSPASRSAPCTPSRGRWCSTSPPNTCAMTGFAACGDQVCASG